MNIPSGTCALGEKGCFTDGKCYYNGNCENKVVTNADRIRSMSDEELAKYLFDVEQGNFTIDCCDDRFCDTQNCCHDCTDAAIKWLKQPVKDGEDDGNKF